MILPIPLGSWSTIKACSKCHGPHVNTLRLSSSKANLNIKILFHKLSTLTTPTGLQACCKVVLIPS